MPALSIKGFTPSGSTVWYTLTNGIGYDPTSTNNKGWNKKLDLKSDITCRLNCDKDIDCVQYIYVTTSGVQGSTTSGTCYTAKEVIQVVTGTTASDLSYQTAMRVKGQVDVYNWATIKVPSNSYLCYSIPGSSLEFQESASCGEVVGDKRRAIDGSVCANAYNTFSCSLSTFGSTKCLLNALYVKGKGYPVLPTCIISCLSGQGTDKGAPCKACTPGSSYSGGGIYGLSCQNCVIGLVAGCDIVHGWTTSCVAGSELNSFYGPANTFCGKCSPTTYSPINGNLPCQSCGPNGAICGPISSEVTSCKPGIGLFVPATGEVESRCNSVYTSCEAGQDLNNGCRACPKNSWSLKGDKRCTPCETDFVLTCAMSTGKATSCKTSAFNGKYGLIDGRCDLCPTDSVPKDSISPCPCPTGGICLRAAPAVVVTCKNNYYLNQDMNCGKCEGTLQSTISYKYNQPYTCCPADTPTFTGFSSDYGCRACSDKKNSQQCLSPQNDVTNTKGQASHN